MFSIADSLPHTVNHGNSFFPVSVWDDSYSGDMPAIDPKAILWNNIVALMRHSYGKENINQLHKDSGVSLATITRIKQQETSVGVEIVGKVADAFGLEAWQLMVPNLQPDHAPVLEGSTEVWPFEAPLHKRFMSLSVKSRHMIEAWLQRSIEDREALEGNRRVA